MYNYGEYIKASSHYCPYYLKESMKLLNKISCIAPNSSGWNNAQLIEILLFDRENLDNMNNGSILDFTIKYLIETKRFDAKLFLMLSRSHGFNIDIAFKIYIFILCLFYCY